MPRKDIIHKFDTPERASTQIADELESVATNAIEARGECFLLLSGGSTPINAYQLFRKKALDWNRITIGLVDDRKVPITDSGSNFGVIKKIFSNPNGPAPKLLTFDDFEAAASARSADICIMGMGGDGHTASWFPGAEGLKKAMDINTPEVVIDINASNSPGAAPYSHRRTLTLPVIMGSRNIILFITGNDKWSVFENAAEMSVMEKPVKALFAAGSRLSTYWAPKV